MDHIRMILLIAMVFCHIIDDYYLQGILATMKQRGWWKNNCPDKKYRHDYIAALVAHSVSWAISITLPLTVYAFINHTEQVLPFIVGSIVANAIIHGIIDNMKANQKSINLCQDQIAHVCQIVITWGIFGLIKL